MTQFIDLNLMAADKAAMTKALQAAGFIKDPETGTLYHPTASLQLLPPGMVTRPTGEVQVVGGIKLEVREAVPGYHANVRTQDPRNGLRPGAGDGRCGYTPVCLGLTSKLCWRRDKRLALCRQAL